MEVAPLPTAWPQCSRIQIGVTSLVDSREASTENVCERSSIHIEVIKLHLGEAVFFSDVCVVGIPCVRGINHPAINLLSAINLDNKYTGPSMTGKGQFLSKAWCHFELSQMGVAWDIELDCQGTRGRQPRTRLQIAIQDASLQMGIKLLIEWSAEFRGEWVLSQNNHSLSIQIMSILCSNCINSESHFLRKAHSLKCTLCSWHLASPPGRFTWSVTLFPKWSYSVRPYPVDRPTAGSIFFGYNSLKSTRRTQ